MGLESGSILRFIVDRDKKSIRFVKELFNRDSMGLLPKSDHPASVKERAKTSGRAVPRI